MAAIKAERKTGKEKISIARRLADFIVDHNKLIRNFVILLVIFNAICYFFVNVNYDLTSYLPNTVPSKIAINKMKEIFGYPGTGRLMIRDVSIYEAKSYKNEIEKVDGVDQVVWLDTTTQVYTSSDFIQGDDVSDFYKDGNAVMDITFQEGDTDERTKMAIDEIQKIVGEKGDLVGMAPTNKFIEESVSHGMREIMAIAVLVIFLILLLTTTSWFEPVLFLTVIGCAIVLNKGTNIFLGTISYITNNISDVLQLATSMDYSVFLLHAYERERENGLEKKAAMKSGLLKTITTILASSMTTFFGFIVLVFMKFKMGFDLGVVMSKSIIFSLMMVIFLMPSLLLSWSDLIDRTRHRPFLPSFDGFSRFIARVSPVVLTVSLVLAGPVYIAQGMNHFLYGTDATGAGPRTRIYQEQKAIDEEFGRSNLLVAIVPANTPNQEKLLVEDLKDREYVKKVMSLSGYLPEGVPEDILPGSVTELFHKDGYARLLIYIKTKSESTASYQYTEEVKNILHSYYPENAYLTGETPTTQDMQKILIPDYQLVNNLAMISIFIVVSLSFHSVLMAIAAMIPIMMAIYTNMAIPYLQGDTLIFIAYAVVSCIQLGSTIDYAISETENYLQIRESEKNRHKAAAEMIKLSFPSILTSGTILITCGYTISIISPIPAISEVGHLVGRGAIFSMSFVVTIMPILLQLIDPFITGDPKKRKRHRRALIRITAIRARDRRRRVREKVRKKLSVFGRAAEA